MQNRFYPNTITPFENEPTKQDFEFRNLGNSIGLAVFSKRQFQKGEVVFRFTGLITDTITQHSLQISADQHIHDPWFMGFVSHRCEPNCWVDMKRLEFIATSSINNADRITMNYNQTEHVLFRSFRCDCGETMCQNTDQKQIRGQPPNQG